MPLPPYMFVLVSVIKSLIVLIVLLTAVAYTVWLERKVVGHMQNRWGPSRVGPFGLLQPAADGLKFLFKEDLTPPHVYKPLFLAAPMMAVIFALTSISVIPFGNAITIFGYSIPLQITDVNIGLLMILGVTSMGVYGVALAGWSSNNKYSLLGGLRASAQMISYEIGLGLSLVGVLILSGSFSLRDIVAAQSGRFWYVIPRWNVFHGQFIGFFIYLMAAYAETNRIPFDEICHVLHGRVRQHDHGSVPGDDFVFWRMERAAVRAGDFASGLAAGLVFRQGVLLSLPLYMGARDVAALPL
jgi:NADH-quinone oxidoreductase subunit H